MCSLAYLWTELPCWKGGDAARLALTHKCLHAYLWHVTGKFGRPYCGPK